MSAIKSPSFDGEHVVCHRCKRLLCIVPRGAVIDVLIECTCGAQHRVTYSPAGWTNVRAIDKAADASARVVIAEERLERARRDHKRALSESGKETAKALSGNLAETFNVLDVLTTGSSKAAEIGIELANRTIQAAAKDACAATYGLVEKIEANRPRLSWWRRALIRLAHSGR